MFPILLVWNNVSGVVHDSGLNKGPDNSAALAGYTGVRNTRAAVEVFVRPSPGTLLSIPFVTLSVAAQSALCPLPNLFSWLNAGNPRVC